MKKAVATLLICLTVAGAYGVTRARMSRTLTGKVTEERAVSLKVLQQRLREGRRGDEETYLAGLRRVDAIIADPKNQDIILVGSTAGPKPLFTEDLAVALRSAFDRYAKRDGNTLLVTPPAVSIDPDPQVMASLERALKGNDRPDSGKLAEYRRIAASPQATRVLGMPFSCRAAEVALDCDYYLKRLTNGSAVPAAIPGWESLFDERVRLDRQSESKSQSLGNTCTMDRFWFTAGRATFLEDDGVVTLQSVPIDLKTEAEALSHGRFVESRSTDGLAQEWAAAFSHRFDKIAARDCRYFDLANIYRMFAVAGILNSHARQFQPEAILGYFLDEYELPSWEVPHAVSGISRVEEVEFTRNNELQSPTGMYLCHTSCGGVDLSPQNPAIDRDTSSGSHDLAVHAELIRPPAVALYWPVVWIVDVALESSISAQQAPQSGGMPCTATRQFKVLLLTIAASTVLIIFRILNWPKQPRAV